MERGRHESAMDVENEDRFKFVRGYMFVSTILFLSARLVCDTAPSFESALNLWWAAEIEGAFSRGRLDEGALNG